MSQDSPECDDSLWGWPQTTSGVCGFEATSGKSLIRGEPTRLCKMGREGPLCGDPQVQALVGCGALSEYWLCSVSWHVIKPEMPTLKCQH